LRRPPLAHSRSGVHAAIDLDAVLAISSRAKFVPVARHPRATIKRGDVGGGAAFRRGHVAAIPRGVGRSRVEATDEEQRAADELFCGDGPI
jgi:hypothetical protein